MEMFARNKKGGILTLIVVLVFTAMFLITLYIVGPFVGGAQLSIDILDRQPSRLAMYPNLVMGSKQARRNLIKMEFEPQKGGEIGENLGNVFEDHGDVYIHYMIYGGERYLITSEGDVYDSESEEYKDILNSDYIPGPSRPVPHPEQNSGVGLAQLIFKNTDETIQNELLNIRF